MGAANASLGRLGKGNEYGEKMPTTRKIGIDYSSPRGRCGVYEYVPSHGADSGTDGQFGTRRTASANNAKQIEYLYCFGNTSIPP